ncbi:hypothetical protein A9K65_031565 [Mesorhizobium sp. WSM1497]|nr:hypothetical protein A9K65_031565 [Mesorhizobium sp. WSM1497]PBC13165.1 hypothetical protein CK225_27990 [Mesorhizobium loti]
MTNIRRESARAGKPHQRLLRTADTLRLSDMTWTKADTHGALSIQTWTNPADAEEAIDYARLPPVMRCPTRPRPAQLLMSR